MDAENARTRCGSLPPQKAVISDLTEVTTRGTVYGLHTCASSLGSVVGPVVGGWLYETQGPTTLFVLTGLIWLASVGGISRLRRGEPGDVAHDRDKHRTWAREGEVLWTQTVR